MKIRVSIKKICVNCRVILRNKRLYNICNIKKHKQRQK